MKNVLAIAALTGATLTTAALANRPFPARYDNAVNCFSAVGATAAGIAAIPPASPAAVPIAAFTGGFQIGWWLGRTIIDPPDPANAGNPVNMNQFLSGHQMASLGTIVPGADAQLVALVDASMSHVDQAVALARSVNASLDRYSGALLIGNQGFANARFAEAQGFLSQLKTTANTWASTMQPILDRIDVIDPGFLDNTISISEARLWRDRAAAGQLGTFEPLPWTTYAPTSGETADIMARAAALTDQDINTKFGPSGENTFRAALLNGSLEIASVMQTTSIVPTPGTVALGAIGLVAVGWRKRRAA